MLLDGLLMPGQNVPVECNCSGGYRLRLDVDEHVGCELCEGRGWYFAKVKSKYLVTVEVDAKEVREALY